MPEEPDSQSEPEDDFQELTKLIELLDKAAANVRQLVYRVRPVLRARTKPGQKPTSKGRRRPRPTTNADE